MRRSITAVTLLLLPACGGWGILGGGKSLSYAQYQSLEKGMSAKAVINAFGPASHVLERDGKIRGLTYRCENPNGEVNQLRMVFDDMGRLEKWALSAADGT